MIELQNGTLAVRSVKGKGSVFSFILPASEHTALEEVAPTVEPISMESTSKEIPELLIPVAQPVERSAKILVADDEFINLQVLTNQLTLEGYDVITASISGDSLTNS